MSVSLLEVESRFLELKKLSPGKDRGSGLLSTPETLG